jgi:hypothetical protein
MVIRMTSFKLAVLSQFAGNRLVGNGVYIRLHVSWHQLGLCHVHAAHPPLLSLLPCLSLLLCFCQLLVCPLQRTLPLIAYDRNLSLSSNLMPWAWLGLQSTRQQKVIAGRESRVSAQPAHESVRVLPW